MQIPMQTKKMIKTKIKLTFPKEKIKKQADSKHFTTENEPENQKSNQCTVKVRICCSPR